MYVYFEQLSSTLVIVVSTRQLIVYISKVAPMIVFANGTIQNVLSTCGLPYVKLCL